MAIGKFLSSAYDQLNFRDGGRTFSTRGKEEEELRRFNSTQVDRDAQLLKQRLDSGQITKDKFNTGLQTSVDNNRRSREAADYRSRQEPVIKLGSFLSGFNVDGSKRNDPFSGFNRSVTRPIVGGLAESNILRTGGDIAQLVSGGRYGQGLSRFGDTTGSSFSGENDNFFQKVARATPGLAQDITLALATGGGSAALKGAKGLSLAQKARKSSQLVRSGATVVGVKHGVNEAADQFRGSLDAGNSLGEAYATGIGSGVVQGAITRYGMQNLLNPIGRNAVTRLASRTLSEGIEEGSQQISSNLFTKVYDANTGTFDGAVEAALIGAVLGGGVSSVDVAKDLISRGVPPADAFQGAKDIEQKAQETIEDSERLDDIVRGMQKDVQYKEPSSDLSKIGKFKKTFVDSLSPIEDLVAKLERDTGTKVTDKLDVTDALDRSLRSGLIHKQFLDDSGFTDVIRDVPDIDLFDQYLIAKRSQEVEATGRKTGRDAELDQRIIETYGPEYEQYAQKIYNFTKQMREYMVESGTYSRELTDALERDNPLYVPLERDIEITPQGPGGTNQVASLGRPTTVKGLKGSDKDIVSPLQTLLVNSGQMIQQAERNKAARVITDIAAIPGFETIATPLAPGEVAGGRPTISVYRDGVKQVYEVSPEVESAAKSLDVQQLNAVQRLLAVGTRLLRSGATGFNAPFAATNLTKDQQTAFTFSKQGVRSANPVEFARALKAVVTQDALYQDAQRAGATGTLFQANRNNVARDIKTIRSGRGILDKTFHTVRHPSQLLNTIENVIGATEQATRVKQFNVQRKALLKKGVPLEQATREASKGARRDTVDFFRKGDLGPTLNATHAYLNAGIQGSRQLVKSFQKRPVSTSMKVITSMYLPYIAAMAWNYGDEEKQAVYDDIQNYEKENNIIIVKSGEKNEKGQYDVIKIPLAPGISSLLAPVRDFLENDPDGGRNFSASSIGQAITGATTPVATGSPTQLVGSAIPDLLRPTIEQATNLNFFTGDPIVKEYLEDLPEEQQVSKGTSGTAKKLGGLLGVAPVRIDAFIKSTGAGVGNQFINAADNALAAAGVIEDSEIRGESALTNLTRRYSKAYGGVQEDLQREERQDIIDSLSDADRAAFDSLHTYNYVDGEIQFQDKPLFTQEKAATYVNSPAVFEVDRTLAYKDNAERGKPIDPIFAVPDEIKDAVLLSRIALPGESGDLKKQILYEQPWYDEWRLMQDKYYDAKAAYNSDQGYDQEPRDQDGYPQASPELQSKLDFYYGLEAGTGERSAFIQANPDISEYFDATKRFKNVQRAKLGLPPVDDGFSNFGSSGSGSSSSRTIRPSSFGDRIAVSRSAPTVSTSNRSTPKVKRQQRQSRDLRLRT